MAQGRRKRTKNSASISRLGLNLIFAAGLFLFFLSFVEGENLWQFLHDVLLGFFGKMSFFVGASLVFISVLFSLKVFKGNLKLKFYQFFVLFILISSQIQIHCCDYGSKNLIEYIKEAWTDGKVGEGGGVVGEVCCFVFRFFFGRDATIIVFWILLFVFSLIITSSTLVDVFKNLSKPISGLEFGFNYVKNKASKVNIDIPINNVKSKQLFDGSREGFFEDGVEEIETKKSDISENRKNEKRIVKKIDIKTEKVEQTSFSKIDDLVEKASKDFKDDETDIKACLDGAIESDFNKLDGYKFPPVNLLSKPEVFNGFNISSELKVNAERLVDTLRSFGVETRITDICRGPSVTRYELQPSAGIKISKITNLADDISLNLAAGGVRIEAPIPNKAAVGIEVPNKKKETVFLREIVASLEFSKAKSPLTFSLGKDIAGNVKVADIAKMPHVLIAGATGSGKSVCINSLIVSLLYKSSPEDVRLLMIDPKVVELCVYNGIPHLLVPVVTDPKKASGALGWAVSEMLKRYKIFAETGVRDMHSYNDMVKSGRKKENGEPYLKMPQIVIIIDELADLMMAASKEVENSICRLAQMARAAGMHLVIATQRPSVDVITGLIKANIPSRIAFTVSSQIDSRTIIDSAGAEKLLGKGDMLYFPIDMQKPVRIQGCFLTDSEVEQVVNFIKLNEPTKYSEKILEEIEKKAAENDKNSSGDLADSTKHDAMFLDALEVVVDAAQASTSFLQRRLKLGYSRAARIMDEMEAMGFVGPQCGSKPREVLISKQQFLEMKLGN